MTFLPYEPFAERPNPARVRATVTRDVPRQCVAFTKASGRSGGCNAWKTRILSPGEAIRVASKPDAVLDVYRCEHCGGVHAGNPVGVPKKRQSRGASLIGDLCPQLEGMLA